MECRQVDMAFDVAAAAGWYSAIAGLLAGFALVALLLPLDHEAESGDDENAASAVVEFVCAFFALVVLAFAYAVLSGRLEGERTEAVAAHEQLLLGPALGLSTLLLLIGLYSVIGSYGRNRSVFRPAQGVILAATATLGPILVLVLGFSNTLDVGRTRVREGGMDVCAFLGLPNSVTVNLAIVGIAIALILLVGLFRGSLPRLSAAGPILAKGVLGLVGIIVIWTSLFVPFVSTVALSSPGIEHLALSAAAIAAVAFSFIAWSLAPSEHSDTDEPRSD
jgi:hypothetical protein